VTGPANPSQGQPDEAKAAQDAKESAEAAAQASAEQAAEASQAQPEATEPAEEQAAQAEGTAAETTGVDKAGAEAAAVTEPAAEPAVEPETTETEADAAPAEERPKRSRSRKAAEPAKAEPKAAPKRRRDATAGEKVIVQARARYVRSSARKARLVSDNVRGKTVTDARAILAFSPRAVAEPWSKLLESAVANAENNHDLVGEDLKIHAIFADEGPTIKRYRPRAMGRATRIRKRTSHLTIQLTPKD